MANWKDDGEFYENTIDEVEEREDGYTIKHDGLCFGGIYKPCPIVPKVGMKARFFAKGVFYQIRGLVIDGVPIFYRTREEQEAQNEADAKAADERKRAEFEKNRTKMDAKYDALPEVLRRRIDRFRTNNPNFRWDFEPYELFCCTQATAIFDSLQTAEAIERFHGLKSWEEQKAMVPGISDDHSGNTFGCACRLAMDLATAPENAALRHGALAPLVGSERYGCVPPIIKED